MSTKNDLLNKKEEEEEEEDDLDFDIDDLEDEDLEGLEEITGEDHIKELIENTKLNWIFVGGKGGVGKTTISSCLSIKIANHRKEKKLGDVLIISTDPAHNLSDAFDQKFGDKPQKVNGFDNLFGMEITPKINLTEESLPDFVPNKGTMTKMVSSMNELPGIDEIFGFLEIMKLVKDMKFNTVIFDTAPTGHTLRLLSFPQLLESTVSKIMEFNIGGMVDKVSKIMGIDASQDTIDKKIKESHKLIQYISEQFKAKNGTTTFMCVCIPEFLSVYETERLVQELIKNEINCGNIVVNQLVFPPQDSHCVLCKSRVKIQKKYLKQIFALYSSFNIVQSPLLGKEIRGTKELSIFSDNLVNPLKDRHKREDK